MYTTNFIEDAFSIEDLSEKIEEKANEMHEKGYELVTTSSTYESEYDVYHAVLVFKK